MLEKVKEINFALAGQPDLEKVASLFHESTEYRIWRWGDHKCFTLYKTDFSSSFKSIEEEMLIRSVIPYELTIDTQQKFISGTYIYHLQERSSGNRFTWFSTCIYSFDPNVNLTKISQQGELYPEGEVEIPFEIYSQKFLVKRIDDFMNAFQQGYDAFYTDLALYDSRYYSVMPVEIPNPGFFQGIKHIDKLGILVDALETMEIGSFKIIETFVDYQNASHDSILVLACDEGKSMHGEKGKKEIEPCIFFTIFHFENGKIAKELDFISILSIPIPTPFEDKNFRCRNTI